MSLALRLILRRSGPEAARRNPLSLRRTNYQLGQREGEVPTSPHAEVHVPQGGRRGDA